MASAAAQGAPRVLGRRRPRPRAPPENAPQNLRGFPNHRCRGAAAASGAVTPPRPPHPGTRTRREVSCGESRPSGGAGGRGVGSRGARGAAGGAPTLPAHSPTPAPQLVPRDLRRQRAAGAALLCQRRRLRLRGSPGRWAEKKPWCSWGGDPLSGGKA